VLYSLSPTLGAAPNVIEKQPSPSPKPPHSTLERNPTPPTTPLVTPDIAQQLIAFSPVPAPVVAQQLATVPPPQHSPGSASAEEDDEVFQHPQPAAVNPLVIDADTSSGDFDSSNSDIDDEMTENFHPGIFNGKADEDAVEWLKHFENYCAFKGFEENKKMALIKVLLIGNAATWLDTISATDLATFAAFKAAFEARFKLPDILK